MPIQVSYPGVYVQEIPGSQPTVPGVSTASTAFVDFFARGPMYQPMRVTDTQSFDRIFGGLNKLSESSYGIRQYFLNGGQEAWVVRAADGTQQAASLVVAIKTPGLPYRVQASLADFQAAQEAATQALQAAQAASDALGKLQVPGLTDQERDQGTADLQQAGDQAAAATQAAAVATQAAAVQAAAASQELALAIAKVEAASSPVADRVSMAAAKSAAAAQASSDAAKSTNDVATVALSANDLATAALQAGSAARAASTSASALNDALAAITAVTAAVKATGDADKKSQSAKDLATAQSQALAAASQAATAADQAQQGATKIVQAAQNLLSRLNADATAAQSLSNATQLATPAAPQAVLNGAKATFDTFDKSITDLGTDPTKVTVGQLQALKPNLAAAVQAQADASGAVGDVTVADADAAKKTAASKALNDLSGPLGTAQSTLGALPATGNPTADQLKVFTDLDPLLKAAGQPLTDLAGVDSLTKAVTARDADPQAKALGQQQAYQIQTASLGTAYGTSEAQLTLAQSNLTAAQENLATVQAANAGVTPVPQAVTDAQTAVTNAEAAVNTAQGGVTTARNNIGGARNTFYTSAYSDLPEISKAQQVIDDANAVSTAAQAVSDAAAAAEWDAQTALDLESAQAASTEALDAANQAQALANGPAATTPTPTLDGLVASYLPTVLAAAAKAADAASYLAGKAAATGQPQPANDIAKGAMDAINEGMKAARTAAMSATGAAQDAKVASDSVASAASTMAARAAIDSASQAAKDTAATSTQAKAILLQVNTANMTAAQSVKPATDASAAAKAAAPSSQAGVNTALDTSQKALNAANNALAVAESVEQAAVATANVANRAAQSAIAAAQSAQAAVLANEEANQDPTLTFAAVNPGVWGDNIQVTIQVIGTVFTVSVAEIVMQNGVARTATSEFYSNLTLDAGAPPNQRALEVINTNSALVAVTQFGPKVDGAYPATVAGSMLDGGADGNPANADQINAGIDTLSTIEPAIFNLLCIPAVGNMETNQASVVINYAAAYCQKKRAFFIVDIPASVTTVSAMQSWANSYMGAQSYSMATYFPRLIIPDPLNNYRDRNVGASGTVAGIYARTDTARGVWKAPAGIDAVLKGAQVAVTLNDDMNGQLNPLGINVLRSFPIYGNIVWGARTLAGADALSSEYKYINVRRLMNFIEESIFESLKWAVFEPNNETLWGKIRLQLNGFLAGLFAQGAFQGATPAASYFVQCDGKSTTPLDIDMGIVNVLVGVAPVKPAEFIVLSFQQIAGQSAS